MAGHTGGTQPVQPAATAVSPVAPSGTVTAAAVCCPDVATFEESTAGRNSYFGFDDKTNLVANVGVDEYWIPPTDAKTLQGKQHRDGARWVSVGVGQEAQLEINFDGTFTPACLANCTFDVDPAGIADVISAQPVSTGAVFKIKGKAAGEASLKVMCDGKLRGYFHIWCAQPAVINIGVGTIKVTAFQAAGSPIIPIAVPAATYSVANLTSMLNLIFRQSLITFAVTDMGTVDFDAEPAATLTAVRAMTFSGPSSIFNGAGIVNPGRRASNAAYQAWLASLGGITSLAKVKVGGGQNYNIWFLAAPTQAGRGSNGVALTVPGTDTVVFNTGSDNMNTICHEVGHLLGLYHPNDGRSAAQLPAHLRDGTSRSQNWDPDDNLNLMGYGSPRPMRVDLRYGQWKSTART